MAVLEFAYCWVCLPWQPSPKEGKWPLNGNGGILVWTAEALTSPTNGCANAGANKRDKDTLGDFHHSDSSQLELECDMIILLSKATHG